MADPNYLTLGWEEGDRDIDVTVSPWGVRQDDDVVLRVQAYTETGQMTSGTRRESKTWHFGHKGMRYRVQIQRWHDDA